MITGNKKYEKKKVKLKQNKKTANK
jgi:hypothetical protein